MQAESLDRTLVALADPTRRAILARLRLGEARVTEIARPFDVSLNAISKHVKMLERAGDGAPLREAAAWIDDYRAFWEDRLAALDAFLREKGKP
jgi:DNA-binding transcriptional ArsR family regulator